nr:MAG TPA: hypothetical protein [Bacteriophage sp.]
MFFVIFLQLKNPFFLNNFSCFHIQKLLNLYFYFNFLHLNNFF